MKKPLIGITTYSGTDDYGHATNYQLSVYLQALTKAGALAVMVPLTSPDEDLALLAQRLDGILFSGGGDIATERFDGEPHSKVYKVDPERDRVEFGLLNNAIRQKTPLFGICRGLQVVNVGLGGGLYTHLPDQFGDRIPHPQPGELDRSRKVHLVRVEPGTRLAGIIGEGALMVNSIHHQGIKDLAPGLVASACAEDGLVEAVELADHPFGIAVQWHPEWLVDDEKAIALFDAFVKAARS
jgi:putative glutamine amidotransferase